LAAAVGLCSSVLGLVSVSAAFLPATVLAAHVAIAPSAAIEGTPRVPGKVHRARASRVVPLRVRDPVAYAREKHEAARPAGASASASAAVPRGAASSFGPEAAVFGSLNQSGLSAEAQIGKLGEAGDVTPPDTTGAIGPSDYVEFVNNEAAAYERGSLSLAPGSPVSLETLTGGVEICDPQIKYDPQTSRWFYVALRCDGTKTGNELYVGFSKTSDPTNLSTEANGGWCGYKYSTGEALEDYPKLGLDAQHIIIGTNSFSAETEAFLTAHIFSAPKPASGGINNCPTAPKLTAFGSASASLKTSIGNLAFTPEPATVASGSANGFVVAADVESGKNIMIWQVAGTAETPKLQALGAPEVPAFAVPPNVPQPGGSKDELDSLDGRLTQAVAAADSGAGGAEAVWTQHTVAGGAGSVVRWYELLPGKLEVKQTGTISDPSLFVFNGAIAPTLSGGAVINYDTASETERVHIVAQSRVGSAPAGTMSTPIVLRSSAAIDGDFSCPSQTHEEGPCRWGDYAGASVDPINENVVWGSNQVNGPTPSKNQAQWATQNFAITVKGSQAITFTSAAPGAATVGATTYTVAATASSGLPVSFSSAAPSVCSLSGSTVSFLAVGTCTIDANQAGNSNYDAAPQIQQSFAVGKGSQTITFTSTAPSSATVGGPTYTVAATGGASGNPVTFTIDVASSSVCSLSGATVSFIAAGMCTIDANQAGNSNYDAAPQVQQSFAVGRGLQLITFTSSPPNSATVGGPTHTVTATASSGLPVSLSSGTTSVCSLTGSTVSFIAAGMCTIDANQAGNSNYDAAPQVQQSFAVGKVAQTVAFSSTALNSGTVGGTPYTVAATASSGLPVSFSSATPLVCSLSGSTVSFLGVGMCTIDADQPGDEEYEPAPQVQQSFAVASEPVAASFQISRLPSELMSGGGQIAVVMTAPNSNFSIGNTKVNPATGAITFTASVSDPGAFSWLLTFQNGKFGVFASTKAKCKAGFVRLRGKCRPAKVLYARGGQTFAAAGTVKFTVKASASAKKALENALNKHTGLPVTAILTFQSSLGGTPVLHTRSITVKLSKAGKKGKG
jgi:hypothetical protein